MTLKQWCLKNNKMQLLNEWDYDKNGDLKPVDVTAGSGRKVWWKCKKCGNEWQATINNRTNGECRCKICSGIEVYKGHNDLATTHPEIAKQWNKEKNGALHPSGIRFNSSKRVWWICENGHEYDMPIAKRTIRGDNCPYCSNQRLKVGYNDFETWCIENNKKHLLKEWNYKKNTILPTEVTISYMKKIYWKCEQGHEWEEKIKHRLQHNDECPICSNKMLLKGYNDLKTWCTQYRKENILLEWDTEKNNVSFDEIAYFSTKQAHWKCGYEHEYIMPVKQKTFGKECPICARIQKYSFAEKSIFHFVKKYFPDAQENKKFEWLGNMELDIFIPSINIGIEYDGDFFHKDKIFSDKLKYDLCQANSVFLIRIKEPQIDTIDDCGYFIKRKSYKIEELNLIIYNLLSYIGIENPNVDIIEEEQEILNNINLLVIKNSFYAFCKQHKLEHILAEWDYDINIIDPRKIPHASTFKVYWKCKNGHSYKASICSKTRLDGKASGCPVCSNSSLYIGQNDFKTYCEQNNKTHLLDEWDYDKNKIKPNEIISGGAKFIHWKCALGHTWKAKLNERINGTNCPVCTGRITKTGFNDLFTKAKQNKLEYLIDEWDYDKNKIDPTKTAFASHEKVWWRCKNGHSFDAVIKSRTLMHTGCRHCYKENIKKIINLDTGDVFNGMADVIKKYPNFNSSPIYNCISGRTKTAYGFRWANYE